MVDSLHLAVDLNATFRMQPSCVIRSVILRLKALIEQFVSERVFVPDISCSHASSLVSHREKRK